MTRKFTNGHPHRHPPCDLISQDYYYNILQVGRQLAGFLFKTGSGVVALDFCVWPLCAGVVPALSFFPPPTLTSYPFSHSKSNISEGTGSIFATSSPQPEQNQDGGRDGRMWFALSLLCLPLRYLKLRVNSTFEVTRWFSLILLIRLAAFYSEFLSYVGNIPGRIWKNLARKVSLFSTSTFQNRR